MSLAVGGRCFATCTQCGGEPVLMTRGVCHNIKSCSSLAYVAVLGATCAALERQRHSCTPGQSASMPVRTGDTAACSMSICMKLNRPCRCADAYVTQQLLHTWSEQITMLLCACVCTITYTCHKP